MKAISLIEFEAKLKEAQSAAELDEALNIYLKSWKITAYTFSYFAQFRNNQNRLIHELSSANMQAWHNYYHEENFDSIDQTARISNTSLIPVYWETEQQLKAAKTEKDRNMRMESIKFGVTKGLSIPIHNNNAEYAELTLRQFTKETCLENWEQHKYEWQCAALYYFHYLKTYLQTQPLAKQALKLTPREQQCLNLLIQNYSNAAIAQQLGLTERTLNFHIQNLNHKLGTRNKYQSIAKALSLKNSKNQ